MVRASHDHHSSGPWSLKDRSDPEGNAGIKGRTVSTRILGVGIVLVGALILAIGLIMGLEFPNYVNQQNRERQCVVFEGHVNYKAWSEGSQWDRRVLAYYWTLTNAEDFLFKGQLPKFVQRGPYVYQETLGRYNVTFTGTEVTYRQRRRHIFDKEATASACDSCREDDTLTIISPWYLQTVGQYGGERALGWALLPKYINTYLKAAGIVNKENSDKVFRENITLLGNFLSEVFNSSSEPLANVSFGRWLYLSTSDYKSAIEDKRGGQAFTLSEVTSLYTVLTNVTLLAGLSLSLPDHRLQAVCKQWAQSLCVSVSPVLQENVGLVECGVVYILDECRGSLSSAAVSFLQETFCPDNGTDSCLNLADVPDDLLLAYQTALSDFLLDISSLVLQHFLASTDLSVTVSMNQSQLATGYKVGGSDVFPGFHKPGLLQSTWIGDTRGPQLTWKVHTCLESRKSKNNMKLIEYNNSRTLPEGLLRSSTTREKILISSFTDYVTPCSDVATCKVCSSPGPAFRFFLDDLLRGASFVQNASSLLHNVKVFRYHLHADVFRRSNVLKIDEGFQNMTGVTGYLSFASLPRMAGCPEVDNTTSVRTMASSDSYVLVEPVTGRVWKRSIKLQWNVGISHESSHVLGRNISVAELPLPVFWTDRQMEITDQEVKAYKHLITRLMAVSCGGIIGFGAVAFVTFIVGIVVCIYPFSQNRILPVTEESNTFPNSRYL